MDDNQAIKLDRVASKPGNKARRWFPFSMRSLLVGVLLCGLVCCWFTLRMRQARLQQYALAEVRKVGGSTGCTERELALLGITIGGPPKPSTPAAWHRRLLGDDFFDTVTWVYADGTQLTDADLVPLRNLAHLDTLLLSKTSITDEGIRQISGFDDSQAEDIALANIQELSNLQSLSLSGTKITDSGLIHLSRLAKLSGLSLEGTQVTDKGLDRLKSLSSLTHLKLSGSRVSADGVKRLRRSLPKCDITP